MAYRWLNIPVLMTVGVLLAAAPSSAAPSPLAAALKHYEADEFSKAEELIAPVVRKSPDDIRARLLLGWSIWGQGRYDEALVIFKAVLHEAPAHRVPTAEEYDAFDLPRSVAYIENPDLLQARKGLGWSYYKKGWPRAALEQFQLMGAKASTWDEPYLGRGYARLALGDLKGAREDFTQHVKLASDKKNGERALGDLSIAEKKPDGAAQHYERALKLKPKWPDVQVELAWTYVALDRLADAEKLFDALQASRPLEREVGRARIALGRRRYDDAEAALARILSAQPGHARALEVAGLLRQERYRDLDRAWSLYGEGKLAEAATAFESVLSERGGLPPASRVVALNGLGWTRLGLKDFGAAQRAFEESLRTTPDGAEATAGLGWVALNRKDWPVAEKAFTEAAAAAPQLASAQRGLIALREARFGTYDKAWSLYYGGKVPDALAAFERLSVAPGDLPSEMQPFLSAGAAWARLELGQLEDAERAFATLAKATGAAGAEGRAGLGWVALKRKQFDQARSQLADVLKVVPGHQAAQRGLAQLRRIEVPELDGAWTSYNRGKFQDAADSFRRIAEKPDAAVPYGAEATRGLAWALLRGGKFLEALPWFQKLVVTAADADSFHGRGLALSSAGRHAEAQAALKQALALAPTSIEIQLALGWAALRGGDPKAAEDIFLGVSKLAPASAAVNRALGWARARQNRPADALPALRFALAEAPAATDDADLRKLLEGSDYASLKRDLAWGYVRWHGFEQARALFEDLVRLDKHDGDALFGLGYVFYKLGKYKEADQQLERAVSAKRRPVARTAWVLFPGIGAYPILTDASSIRGWAALASNDAAKARQHFQASLERNPDLVSSLAGLALALQRSGDRAAARDAYVRAGEIYPTYPVVVAGLRETDPAAAKGR